MRKATASALRQEVWYTLKVKNSQSRLNKSLAILRHLKEAQGQLDFKKLNEWIKYYNNLPS